MHTIALLLLLAPDLPDLPPASLPPDVYQAVKDVAELLDIYARHGNWQADSASELRWARAAFRSTHDCPPSADACWLPDVALIRGALEFNERYVKHLGATAYPSDDALLVRDEALRLRCVWELALRAKDAGPAKNDCRLALKWLRERIGEEAYRAGAMPPWVPVWRMAAVE